MDSFGVRPAAEAKGAPMLPPPQAKFPAPVSAIPPPPLPSGFVPTWFVLAYRLVPETVYSIVGDGPPFVLDELRLHYPDYGVGHPSLCIVSVSDPLGERCESELV